MHKNTRSNLFWFAAVLVLGIAAFGVQQQQNKNQSIFLPIDAQQLQRIVINKDPVIELKKINNHWQMLAPLKGKVKDQAMAKILDTLAAPLYTSYAIEEVSLETLGLERPNLRVLLDDEALDFGALASTQQMHYVRYQDRVYLASPFLQVRFNQSPEQLLDVEEVEDVE
ncbi:MAG: hypothetical protein HKN88_10355 [Gammaproteobacteria bacterium]|nr:hypothetical protein [Gammaproteobacteria bacterium]NNC98458.1 hypothetical protein [Gammaproteobacteria bacterium]NNM14765.1 hypothetical protein [Gammaproteobacteria bacterium]